MSMCDVEEQNPPAIIVYLLLESSDLAHVENAPNGTTASSTIS